MFDFQAARVIYLRGEYEKAAELFREGARDGDALASFCYGYSLLYGKGVEQDFAKAKSYFAFARDLEGGESAYNLAVMYMHGKGVVRNYKKSFEYMQASALKGCIEAQLYLGMAYTTGYWLEPDIVSVSLIPYHTPDYRLGTEYMLVGDVPDAELDEDLRFSVVAADGKQAFEWFAAASRQDPTYVGDLVAKGKFLYAKCYLDGLGTDFNMQKGTRLMLLAGKSGSQDALNYLSENAAATMAFLEDEKKRGGRR